MNKTNYKLLFTTSILSSVIAISGFVGHSFAAPKNNKADKKASNQSNQSRQQLGEIEIINNNGEGDQDLNQSFADSQNDKPLDQENVKDNQNQKNINPSGLLPVDLNNTSSLNKATTNLAEGNQGVDKQGFQDSQLNDNIQVSHIPDQPISEIPSNITSGGYQQNQFNSTNFQGKKNLQHSPNNQIEETKLQNFKSNPNQEGFKTPGNFSIEPFNHENQFSRHSDPIAAMHEQQNLIAKIKNQSLKKEIVENQSSNEDSDQFKGNTFNDSTKQNIKKKIEETKSDNLASPKARELQNNQHQSPGQNQAGNTVSHSESQAKNLGEGAVNGLGSTENVETNNNVSIDQCNNVTGEVSNLETLPQSDQKNETLPNVDMAQLDNPDYDMQQKQLAIMNDIESKNLLTQVTQSKDQQVLPKNLDSKHLDQGTVQVSNTGVQDNVQNQSQGQTQVRNTAPQSNSQIQSAAAQNNLLNQNLVQVAGEETRAAKVIREKLDAQTLDDDVDKAVSYAKDINNILNPHLAERDPQIRKLVDLQNQLLQDVSKTDVIQKNPNVIKALHEKILSINPDPVLGKKAVLNNMTEINNVIGSASLSQEMQGNLRKLQDGIDAKSKDLEDFFSEDQLEELVGIRSEIEGSLSKHRKVKVKASIDKSGNRKAAALRSSVKSSANIIRNVANQRFTNMHSSVAAAIAAGSDVAAYDSAVWINGFLGSSKDKVDENKNKAAFFGGSIGYEFKFDDSALLGVAFTVARDNSKAAQQKIGNTNYLVSVYNSTAIDEVLLNAGLFLGGGKATSKREVVDLDKSVSYADGNYNTRAFGLYGNIGYKISSDQHMLIPSVGLNYSYALNDNYTEVGSTANLVVDKHSASNLAGELALQYSYTMDTPMGMLIPSLQIGFIADLMQKNSDLKQKFIDVHSSTLKVKSVKNNAIKIAPELTLKNAYCDVAISYYREQGLKKYMTQVGSAKVTIKF